MDEGSIAQLGFEARICELDDKKIIINVNIALSPGLQRGEEIPDTQALSNTAWIRLIGIRYPLTQIRPCRSLLSFGDIKAPSCPIENDEGCN